MEPVEIPVRIDGVEVCRANVTKEAAIKAADLSVAMAAQSVGSTLSDSEQLRPLLELLLGSDGLASLDEALESDPWRLAEAWTALSLECQRLRMPDVAKAAIRYTARDYEPQADHVSPRSRPLTDCKPGRSVGTYAGISVNDSASTMMRALDVLSDKTLANAERLQVLNALVLHEPDGFDFRRLADACWLAFGIDLADEHPDSSRQVLDWCEDAGRVRTSLRMAYGISWDDIAATTPFMDVVDMVSGLMEGGTDTPLRQAVRFRSSTVPQNATAEQRKAYMDAVEHFAIRREASDPYGDEYLRSIG